MIRLKAQPLNSVEDAWAMLQMAIELEFSTLPPYLYAKFSILPDTNARAAANLGEIVGQEMVHLCLACNILNALGGSPVLTNAPHYPGPLPGDIGPPDGDPITVCLLPFSLAAMQQGMAIERPEQPINIKEAMLEGTAGDDGTETIGQFYGRLDQFLATLDESAWHVGRNQIDDSQFFQGQLLAVNNYADAHVAISQIVSEGEGSTDSPLDFQSEVSHYYRFDELARNLVLTKSEQPSGYQWGPEAVGVDFTAAYPAICNPQIHDFSKEPQAAQDAQHACNLAYSQLIDMLQLAFNGQRGQLGLAVRAMFDLRKAAVVALNTPLADGQSVAGPSFLYHPPSAGASS
jgi:hypothetical protein